MSAIIEPRNFEKIDKCDDIDIEALLSRSRPLTTRRGNFCQAPEFITRLEPYVEVEQGATVSLQCKIKGFPSPVIKWYKDEDELEGSDRVTLNEQSGQLTLVIIDVIKKDEATYKCKAENQEGVTSTLSYLSVKGDKLLSKQGNSKRHNNKGVSFPPLLRTIREQHSLEGPEEEEYKILGPSPLHDEIEKILRRGHTWPRLKRSKAEDLEDEPTSASTSPGDTYEIICEDECRRLMEEGWDSANFIPLLHGQISFVGCDEDEDEEGNVFYDESKTEYYVFTKQHPPKMAGSFAEMPWLYLAFLIALSTFYASLTNCPAHWYILFWLLVSFFLCVTR